MNWRPGRGEGGGRTQGAPAAAARPFPLSLAWALVLAAPVASAHVREEGAAGFGWTLDAWVVVPLLVAAAWFLVGQLRLRARSLRPRAHRRQALLFWSGWAIMAGALVSPLHAAGERSFAAHMLEHELLMLVAAPLLVLARPVGVALWALPQGWRQRAAGLRRDGWVRRPWQVLADPLVATTLQILALWAWHAPVLFDLALAEPGWHIAQHVSFVVTALLFWNAVLDARLVRARAATAIGCLFVTAIVSGALGALMALSSSPWYEGYVALGMTPFGLSPAEDQQLAGLLMWVPGGLVHVLAALVLLARWLRERLPDAGEAAR